MSNPVVPKGMVYGHGTEPKHAPPPPRRERSSADATKTIEDVVCSLRAITTRLEALLEQVHASATSADAGSPMATKTTLFVTRTIARVNEPVSIAVQVLGFPTTIDHFRVPSGAVYLDSGQTREEIKLDQFGYAHHMIRFPAPGTYVIGATYAGDRHCRRSVSDPTIVNIVEEPDV